MCKTPIADFVRRYAELSPVRLHMPGHKGLKTLGFEPFDITEIDGADDLFAPNGIILKSEQNAGRLFACPTYYSAGGSTLCIQTMLYLLQQYAVQRGEKPYILAGRNAHKAFINAAALLGIDVGWIYPKHATYHSCPLTAAEVEEKIKEKRPTALYITSPDYLGNVTNIEEIAAVCHKHGVLLAVDNAHGAYLAFLEKSKHPIALGADICCDSAHKTLPVITGGAYLHMAKSAPPLFFEKVKTAFSLFGSSSPSYLILQSLDMFNASAPAFSRRLSEFLPKAKQLKDRLAAHGFETVGTEELKITIKTKPYGYLGTDFAKKLKTSGMYAEYADPDFVVLMLSPLFSDDEMARLENALLSVPKKAPILQLPPAVPQPKTKFSPAEAIRLPSDRLCAENCENRVLALSAVSCPPAIPLVVCGEIIDRSVIENFNYYGIDTCDVCKI